MKLEDVRIGNEYIDCDFGHVLYVGPHPHDGACLIVEVIEDELFESTEASNLTPVTAH